MRETQVHRSALWALIVVLVGGGVLHYGARTTNDIRLPGTGTQQASDLLGREFPPQQNGASPLVFHVSHGKLTDPANKAAIVASLHTIAAMPDVHSVLSPFARGMQSFISKDDRTAVAQVLLDLNYGQLTQAKAAQVFAGADAARKAGIQVEVGGGIGSNISVMKTRLSEEIGVGAAIVILAITFGALVAAGMPVLTALVGLVVGLGLVGLLGHVLSVPNVAPTLATMIGLGVGIDYALFIVFRHRDQLHRGMPVEESVALAIATSGSAVVFAGGTVIVALLALLVANVPILGAQLCRRARGEARPRGDRGGLPRPPLFRGDRQHRAHGQVRRAPDGRRVPAGGAADPRNPRVGTAPSPGWTSSATIATSIAACRTARPSN